jgi:hypothetical protein
MLFLWATCTDETVLSGSKYGFTIGLARQQTYQNMEILKEGCPELQIYISNGPRAGDNMT